MPDDQVGGMDDDMSGADVEAERAAIRDRVERVRRRLGMNVSLPLSADTQGREAEPLSERESEA